METEQGPPVGHDIEPELLAYVRAAGFSEQQIQELMGDGAAWPYEYLMRLPQWPCINDTL
eukprot:12416483-Karenia_brevis.AAC.1